MKIFISWSGVLSYEIGATIRDWLPNVIQATKPYFSPEDIEKGARWFGEISNELEASTVGLLCLTPSNLEAPWLIFEAGALAKSMDKTHVIPMLFGVKKSELKGPLLQFQAADFNKDEFLRVVKTINSSIKENALKTSVLENVFDKWWPDLKAKIKQIMKNKPTEEEIVSRSDRDLIEEILDILRYAHYQAGSVFHPGLIFSLVFPIHFLHLSEQAQHFLSTNDFNTIGDLVETTENGLIQKYHIEADILKEIKEALARERLTLGMRFK